MEKVILVVADIPTREGSRQLREQGGCDWLAEDSLNELRELTRSSGGKVVGEIVCRRNTPTAAYYVGSGKAEEINKAALKEKADVVIFDNNLSSTQQRNLEDIIKAKTIDRTQLILDIFAQRAKTNEGKIQVELAQLKYMAPRLIGKGIELSRLGGGIGTRGPGEQKLEVDRRRIKEKISRLKKELSGLEERRYAVRKNREENLISSVALVGYTNAGKSTLMNSITGAGVVTEDRLFTTLDPVSRKIILASKQQVLFFDTVGFLHRLPHNLIEAFKATLEEAAQADVLIHVLDVSHPLASEHADSVYEVLKELNADKKPIITALNKIDLASEENIKIFKRRFENSVAISALNKTGLDILIDKVELLLSGGIEHIKLRIPFNNMKLAHLIFEETNVISQKYTKDSIIIEALAAVKIRNLAEKEKILYRHKKMA